ncbi:hypothetical protein DM01DRAFT_1380550 [Hesseltinella vesiculosa]|uniref:Uncharacterized protein n=1 Tax=Hesseltinella vesiculosa TaxID=101127 RepID=A0A1X2GUL8_9FUNG|nr:hypothetical protein DM01DRAFT_1380550 [Hesseltinella vesiculosa]
MVDNRKITLQKLARWHPSQTSMNDKRRAANIWDGVLHPIEHEELKQGDLYVLKIHLVSIGLFQGWNDDMCCFAILRSDVHPLRWSHARYLPGDFDAYAAFDFAGNPTVHLWHKYLRADVPLNWFILFEEARRKQREWTMQVLGHQPPPAAHHPMNTSLPPPHLHRPVVDDDAYSAMTPSRQSEEHLSSISSLAIDPRPMQLPPHHLQQHDPQDFGHNPPHPLTPPMPSSPVAKSIDTPTITPSQHLDLALQGTADDTIENVPPHKQSRRRASMIAVKNIFRRVSSKSR